MPELSIAWLLSGAGLLTLAVVLYVYRQLGRPSGSTARLLKNGAFVAAGLGALSVFGIFNVASLAGMGGASAPVAASDVISLAGCPSDGTTDFQADAFSLANTSGGEFLVTTLSVYPVKSDGSLDVDKRMTYATSPTSTRTAALSSLTCGQEYAILAATQRDNSTGIYGQPVKFKADGPVVIKSLRIDEEGGVTGLTGRAYDLENSAFVYGNDSLDGTNTAYETVRTTFQSTTNNTAQAIGVGGVLRWKIQLAAATEGTVIGGASRVWACLDRAPSEMEVSYVKFNGVELAESKASMNPADAAQIAAFDDCYIIPRPISFVQGSNDLELSLRAKDSQNPSTDMSLRILSEDMILDKDGKTLVSRIFRPSDSRQEVNSRDYSIGIDIS